VTLLELSLAPEKDSPNHRFDFLFNQMILSLDVCENCDFFLIKLDVWFVFCTDKMLHAAATFGTPALS
jgi:hypothetical protein